MKNPFKKGKKIEEEDLIEIRRGEELINQYLLIAQSLQNDMMALLKSKMSKYGLDGQRDWRFDTKKGVIVEVKKPQRDMPMPDISLAPKKKSVKKKV